MSLVSKGDLQYTYSWTATLGDNPKISGPPDNTRFSRHEGYEVIYLINKFADKYSLKNKSSALKLETMINKHLPSDIQSQIGVKKWLADNWSKY